MRVMKECSRKDRGLVTTSVTRQRVRHLNRFLISAQVCSVSQHTMTWPWSGRCEVCVIHQTAAVLKPEWLEGLPNNVAKLASPTKAVLPVCREVRYGRWLVCPRPRRAHKPANCTHSDDEVNTARWAREIWSYSSLSA